MVSACVVSALVVSAPEGLSDVKEGDEVTVTYTGELSEVDAFTGTIISVEKAN